MASAASSALAGVESVEKEHQMRSGEVAAGEVSIPERIESEVAGKPSARFKRPPEPDYPLAPPDRLELRNSNLPLTLGLLFSVCAAFLVFFISLVGGTAGADPFMQAFWRSLGALAVFITLSFVASWFMPMPLQRQMVLDRTQDEDPFGDMSGPQFESEAQSAPQDTNAGKGGGIDVTVTDEMDDEVADEEAFEDEDEPDFALEAARRAVAGSRAASPGTQE